MKKLLMTSLVVLMMASSAFAKGLQLPKGTMMLGGQVGMEFESRMPDKGDNESGFHLSIAPSFGYFVADNFAIINDVYFQKGFGDLYSNDEYSLLGFSTGIRYFFGGGSVVPYMGVHGGMAFIIPDDGDVQKTFIGLLPVGLLISLNEHVAVDLGARAKLYASLEDGGGSRLVVPFGYLGVECFF